MIPKQVLNKRKSARRGRCHVAAGLMLVLLPISTMVLIGCNEIVPILLDDIRGLELSGPQIVDEGGSAQYTASVIRTDNLPAKLIGDCQWLIEKGPGSINLEGLYNAPAAVTSDLAVTIRVIHYDSQGVKLEDTKTISINNSARILAKIIISGPETVWQGELGNYEVTAVYDDGSRQPITSSAALSVNNFGSISSEGVYSAPGSVGQDTLVELVATYTEDGVTKQVGKSIMVIQTAEPVPAWMAMIT